MKLLIDMNLSPRWVSFFHAAGIEANHWSSIGAPNAPDWQIMNLAHANDYIIVTQDLDFGIMLAISRQSKPSVVQLRADDISPEVIGAFVIGALNQVSSDLSEGALLTIDPKRTRLRLLPLHSSKLPTGKE